MCINTCISISLYYINILSLENNWFVKNSKTDEISDMFKGFLSSLHLKWSLVSTEPGYT